MDVIFNIMQVEMNCVTFVSTQHDSFIKRVKWVGLSQPALLTGRVRVEPFSRIPYLDTTRTRHANPN